MQTKLFEHDCTTCKFLGHLEEHDIYLCPQMGLSTLLARFGNDPQEYASMPPFLLKSVANNPEVQDNILVKAYLLFKSEIEK